LRAFRAPEPSDILWDNIAAKLEETDLAEQVLVDHRDSLHTRGVGTHTFSRLNTSHF
jgi:hypothetical protein